MHILTLVNLRYQGDSMHGHDRKVRHRIGPHGRFQLMWKMVFYRSCIAWPFVTPGCVESFFGPTSLDHFPIRELRASGSQCSNVRDAGG